jgi:hypothetical protein
MSDSFCVLNIKKAEETFGKKENKIFINIIMGFYDNCLIQSLTNMLAHIKEKTYQSIPQEIDFLVNGAKLFSKVYIF